MDEPIRVSFIYAHNTIWCTLFQFATMALTVKLRTASAVATTTILTTSIRLFYHGCWLAAFSCGLMSNTFTLFTFAIISSALKITFECFLNSILLRTFFTRSRALCFYVSIWFRGVWIHKHQCVNEPIVCDWFEWILLLLFFCRILMNTKWFKQNKRKIRGFAHILVRCLRNLEWKQWEY